jgi:DNA-binding transcriptional MerR regulator
VVQVKGPRNGCAGGSDNRRGGTTGRRRDVLDPLLRAERLAGQRRYHATVLGKLGFIGVAQSAGFTLREIRELISGVEGPTGMGEQMRSLSSQKLGEIEALLERTNAMKGWLEVAQQCGCGTPSECALFPAPGAETPGRSSAPVIRVNGNDCRRAQ